MDNKDIARKRLVVSQAYPGTRWQERVKKMPDSQIIALYFRLKAKGKIY